MFAGRRPGPTAHRSRSDRCRRWRTAWRARPPRRGRRRPARRGVRPARTTAIRNTFRSITGMRSSVQPLARAGDRGVEPFAVLADAGHQLGREGVGFERPAGRARRPARCPSIRPRTAGTGPARARRSVRRGAAVQASDRRRSDAGDVVAGAGVDLDPVADLDEQRHLERPCRSPASPACGRRTRGRPARPARSGRSSSSTEAGISTPMISPW